MIYKRIIGSILVRDGIAVQSFGFKKYLPIGHPKIIAEYLNRWGIDEICLLDISPDRNSRSPDISLIEEVAQQIQVPLCYGGGVSKLDHASQAISAGADKVLVNTAAFQENSLIADIGNHFGVQAVVGGIDYRQASDGTIRPFMRGTAQDISLSEHVSALEQAGAGEILLNAIDRDGAAQGLDCEIANEFAGKLSVPLILMGGAGTADHVAEALKDDSVDAIAVGNLFNHTEHSVCVTKRIAIRQGLRIRPHPHLRYEENDMDGQGRPLKPDEAFLDDLGFVNVEQEII